VQDLKKMPLGQLSKSRLTEGLRVLSEIQAILAAPPRDEIVRRQALVDKSNKFYMLFAPASKGGTNAAEGAA
jgi:hypothetical protein